MYCVWVRYLVRPKGPGGGGISDTKKKTNEKEVPR